MANNWKDNQEFFETYTKHQPLHVELPLAVYKPFGGTYPLPLLKRRIWPLLLIILSVAILLPYCVCADLPGILISGFGCLVVIAIVIIHYRRRREYNRMTEEIMKETESGRTNHP